VKTSVPGLRVVRAGNPGPFTLDGTRTYLVGRRRVAVVDPGPDESGHVARLLEALAGADRVILLQTHDHADHAGASPALARGLGAPVLGAGEGAGELGEGAEVETDAGVLRALSTPGHARPHLSFHWHREGGIFVGDLLLGEGETTWVGAYPGCVADYLESLDRVEALEPALLFPGHGPPIRDVSEQLRRYREHRAARLEQVRRARSRFPDAGIDRLVEMIYGGELGPELEDAARRSVEAMLHHLEAVGGE